MHRTTQKSEGAVETAKLAPIGGWTSLSGGGTGTPVCLLAPAVAFLDSALLPEESVTPKKSRAAIKIEIKHAHRSGKNANHALSRIVFEATTDLAYGGWTEMWEGED